MIHSLAGGELKQYQVEDLVRLQFENSTEKNWYISQIENIKIGDCVLAPNGILNELQKAIILEIKHNVISTNFPISFKKLKKIYKKL